MYSWLPKPLGPRSTFGSLDVTLPLVPVAVTVVPVVGLRPLGFVLDESRRNGATLPLTALVDQFYGEVQALGGSRQDTSSLIRRLTR